MGETVFIDLQNTCYRWKNTGNGKTRISTAQIETWFFNWYYFRRKINTTTKIKKIKLLFLDLENTLVSRDNITEKFIAFLETDTNLSNLKGKGLEIWIISYSNRS